MSTWTNSDYLAHRCQKTDIGKPKGLIDDDALVTVSGESPDLQKDILEAYRQLGGVKFLVKNPALLEKLLIKSIAPPKTDQLDQTITINIPWLKPDRLSYRNGKPLASDINNVVDLAPAQVLDAALSGEEPRLRRLGG